MSLTFRALIFNLGIALSNVFIAFLSKIFNDFEGMIFNSFLAVISLLFAMILAIYDTRK